MDDLYVAKPLGSRQIDQAFPVVSASVPDLEVERWRNFATGVLGDAGGRRNGRGRTATPPEEETPGLAGIMTVQSRRGYIHGLFCYAVEEDLRHGKVLAVDNFVVLDLFDTEAAASVLMRSMEHLARSFGCCAIHTQLPDPGQAPVEHNPMLRAFRNDGHVVENLRLCKPLDGANDNAANRPVAASGD